MERTIFYSWQSDLPNNNNRGFIQSSLEQAINDIHKDPNYNISPVIDRDTEGVAGSPDISDTIFNKIATSDLFIADLSIINKNSGNRKTPNPNVLLELGFAISLLGWENILLIQNSAYGDPEDLPFDLRPRRSFAYYLDETSDSTRRTEQRKRLRKYFKKAISSILENDIKQPQIPWWGYWHFGNEHTAYGGELFIREVSSDEFLFRLAVYSGAHTGLVTSRAKIVSKNLAYAQIPNGESFGEIRFRKEQLADDYIISIDETASCHYHRGIGVVFKGNFIYRNNSLLGLNFLSEIDLQRVYFLLGQKHYDSLMTNMAMISNETENQDRFEAKIYTGAPRGMFSVMEGIIMISPTGALWIAFIDVQENVVRYFSNINQWKNTLPKTIEKWRERFSELPVIKNEPDDFVDLEFF